MKIGFVGLGNMGTTIANMTAENGHDVLGWEYDTEVVSEINTRHMNSKYLNGMTLNPNVRATTDLMELASGREMIFIALPSKFIRSALEPIKGKLPLPVIVVNLAKGIEQKTGLTSYQIICSFFPDNPCVMLSGPSIANEISRRMPTAVVIAGNNCANLDAVSRVLDTRYFKTSRSDDRLGIELGGILKNIYAIGLGIFDGKKVTSINFRSVYLTLALEEMQNFGVRLGAKAESFFFLSGLGDLFATSMSEHSHNRRLGEYLAEGMPIEAIRTKMGVLPEGYNTLQVVLAMAKERGITLPVAQDLASAISGAITTDNFIESVIKEERMYYEPDSCD